MLRFHSNLPYSADSTAIQNAVTEAIGDSRGDWVVRVSEPQAGSAWDVRITGPNGDWERVFAGEGEQAPKFIRKMVLELLAKQRIGH